MPYSVDEPAGRLSKASLEDISSKEDELLMVDDNPDSQIEAGNQLGINADTTGVPR
jgi:hypothetical protein